MTALDTFLCLAFGVIALPFLIGAAAAAVFLGMLAIAALGDLLGRLRTRFRRAAA